MLISGYGYDFLTDIIDELHPEAVLALGINNTIESCKEISNISRNLSELTDDNPKRIELEKQKNRLIKFNHLINKINNNA
jgi:polynucleotide 5'-kinase involved in rRNA processing